MSSVSLYVLLGDLDPCLLHCFASEESFFYSFSRVLDGTECPQEDGKGVCVEGHCRVCHLPPTLQLTFD